MPRKGQRQSEAFTAAHYNIEITDWDCEFSFGLNAQRDDDHLYSDHRHLYIRGRVLRPRKIKVDGAELTVIPEAGLSEMELQHGQTRPRAVGSVNTEGTRAEGMRLSGYLSTPTDALGLVVQMLIGRRYKYALLYGDQPPIPQGANPLLPFLGGLQRRGISGRVSPADPP
jgi:hypothetical protein